MYKIHVMISHESPILVFGAGAIGERHIGILQKLGYSNIWVLRQRNLPLRNIDPRSVNIITDRNQADTIRPVCAIICTPTSQHLEQTIFCVKKHVPILIEKPLSHNTNKIALLKSLLAQRPVYIQIAYMLRYHPLFQKIKQYVVSGRYGRLINIQTYWGEYLPNWHPWEDYRNGYAAQNKLGGGAALTLSHDLDLVNWLTGSPLKNWNTLKNYRSDLEIDVESGVDISLCYNNGVTAHCHINFHEKVTRRNYRLIFSEVTIEVDYLDNRMTIHNSNGLHDTFEVPDFNRNQMFEDQTKAFLTNIETSQADPLIPILESERIIRICTT